MRTLQAAGLGAFVLLLPVTVEVPAARDSGGSGGETRLTVVGGVGRYGLIERGCEGRVIRSDRHDFRDVGAEARHVFRNGLALGARGGLVREHSEFRAQDVDLYGYLYRESTYVSDWTNSYVNPSIGFEGKGIGVGVGLLVTEGELDRKMGNANQNDPTFHLRLGSLDATYLRISYLESLPLYSGGGMAEIGIGNHTDRLWDCFGGLSAGDPYDGPGLVVRLEHRIPEHVAVSLHSRLGHSGGEPQVGIALGLSYVSTSPREPAVIEPRVPRIPMGSAWGLGPRRPPDAPAPEPAVEKRPGPPPDYGTYQEVDSLPVVLTRVPPEYPDDFDASITATVTVAALIDAQGAVQDVRVIQSIPMLDQVAVACVRQWSFRPAVHHGRAVAYWLVIPLTWGER